MSMIMVKKLVDFLNRLPAKIKEQTPILRKYPEIRNEHVFYCVPGERPFKILYSSWKL